MAVRPVNPAPGDPGPDGRLSERLGCHTARLAADMKARDGSQPDDGYSSPVAPVRGTSGRRLPRSRWIVLAMLVVAAGSFLLGTQVGSSPRALLPTPSAASPGLVGTSRPSSPSVSPGASSPAPTTPPAAPPPASSLSLERALATARTAFLGSSPQIVAAQVARYGDVSRSSLVSPDTWVWVFTARGTFSFAACGGRAASPYPCPSPATTARVILDFRTGGFIEADVPALP